MRLPRAEDDQEAQRGPVCGVCSHVQLAAVTCFQVDIPYPSCLGTKCLRVWFCCCCFGILGICIGLPVKQVQTGKKRKSEIC